MTTEQNNPPTPTPERAPRVWANQVDKKYDVYVERVRGDTHKGVLKVELKGEVLFTKDVIISFGGPFGVDAQDEHDWCEECIKFVDEYEKPKKAEG